MHWIKRKTQKTPQKTVEIPKADLSLLLEDILSGKVILNPQEQCRLFNIPAEIRNNIFSNVVAEQDGQTAIATTDYFYRPDYTHFRYIDTAILRTCRRIWLETHPLPRQQIARRYWAGNQDRRPARLDYAAKEAAKAQIRHYLVKSKNILPCETVQVFIQMFALERGYELNNVLRNAERSIATRHLIITIRYTDWWWWEDNEPLHIESHWMNTVKLPDSLEKLTMELETRQGKKAELDALVTGQVSKWEFSTESDKKLTLSPSSPKSKSYIGTDRPGGESRVHHGVAHNQPPDGLREPVVGEMYYYVVTLDYISTT